jgi:regulator of RNase E activity RraA
MSTPPLALPDGWSVAALADALTRVSPEPLGPFVLPPLAPWGARVKTAGPVALGRLTLVPDDDQGRERYFDFVDRVAPGSVLVLDAPTVPGAVLGELLAQRLVQRGVAGFITTGRVRDIAALQGLALLVCASGRSPLGGLRYPLRFAEPDGLSLGRVVLRPGDWIAADHDGALVIPSSVLPAVITAVGDIIAADRGTRDRIEAGCALREAYPSKGLLSWDASGSDEPL